LRESLRPNFIFQDRLVGSAEKGVAIKDAECLYDFDFRLELSDKSSIHLLNRNEIRKRVFQAFHDIGFKSAENSTTAITLRFPNKGFGADFVIVASLNGKEWVLKRNSQTNSPDSNLYQWEPLPTRLDKIYKYFYALSSDERKVIAVNVVNAKRKNLHLPPDKRRESWTIFVEEVQSYESKQH
jgi:hypothetical protein